MLQKNKLHRVGILIVHGIGEQCQFEHLEQVVRNTASALQADSNLVSVQINVNVSGDAPYRARQQTWRGEGVATAVIEVIDKSKKQTNLEFREVWWSDLDEPNNVKTFLSFWLWGLSLWTKPPYDDRKVGTAKTDMRLPGRTPKNEEELLPGKGQRIKTLHRIYLFLISFIILLLLPLLWTLGRVLRSILGLEIRPDILVEYLGDVKLYQQDAREGKGPLVDLGKTPPRSSIRRRLIKALVEMSLKKYDRWYVLSHSLGTVAAFNGLMETETALPNYLGQNLWKRWCRKYPNQRKAKESLTVEQIEKMLPQRPSWLAPDDIIDRQELFRNLKGFMTYGSPLSKFAVLWPAIVPLNQDESVFRQDFEWINVFDPTDPVSDFTRFFDSRQGQESPLTPREISYKAGQVHLLSHGQYLTFNSKRKNPLIRQVSQWLLSGEEFQEPPEPRDRQGKFYHRLGWLIPKVGGKDSLVVSIYFGLGIFIWLLLGTVISFVLSWIVPWFLNQIPKLLAQLPLNFLNVNTVNAVLPQVNHFLSNPLSYVVMIACTVFIVGVVARLFNLNKNQVFSSNLRKP
jgi:hypothetical protein